MQTDSAYGDVANLRDVQLEREVRAAGTEVRAMLSGLELEDPASKSPYFVFSFEFTQPEELAGEGFSQRAYLQLTPNDLKKPKNTAFRRAMALCKSVLSGIFETKEEVEAFFDGCPSYDGTNGPDLYAFIKDRMESVIAAEFDTALGLDFDGTIVQGEDGSVEYKPTVDAAGQPVLGKPNAQGVRTQLGKYPPKQTIGKVKWLFKAAKAA